MGDAKKMKRAAFYDPYLDTGGGGERYVLTFATALRDAGWKVEFQWKDKKILKWLEERLGINLEGIEVVDNISKGAGYNLCFWLSDGSVPMLFANKNIIHFQTPFHNVGGRGITNRLKFLKIHNIVCNSNFTKTVIDREYGVNSKVLYPPVNVQEFIPDKKEKIILSIGRFSQLQQAKRQDVLVEVFKRMSKKGLKGWQLILAGGSNIGGGDFAHLLKKEAKGYPIKILENVPFSEVKKLYAKSQIFWSAAGFNADENKTPEKVEHFGIAVVESMAAGCVPLVTKKGGHKEIVQDQVDGFLWETMEELHNLTQEIIDDERRMKEIAKKACQKAQKYSEEKFSEQVLELVG